MNRRGVVVVSAESVWVWGWPGVSWLVMSVTSDQSAKSGEARI